MYRLFLTILMVILCGFVNIRSIEAQAPSCTVSASPLAITAGGVSPVTFTIRNNGDTDLSWAHLFASDLTAYSITNSESNYGWAVWWDNVNGIYSGQILPPGASTELVAYLTGTGETIPSMNWSAETSVDGGTNLTSCGQVTVAVNQPIILPTFSNVILVVGTNTVTVTWITDVASSSEIDYGPSTGYGFVKNDSGKVTSHSITIDDLSSSTAYHYRLKSADVSGNIGETLDGTFVTNAVGATQTVIATVVQMVPTTTTTTITNTVVITPTSTPTPIPDTSPPSAIVTTDFSKPYKTSPAVVGKVTDNKNITTVEFSIDGGINWLPVETINKKGEKTANIEFTPDGLEDGSYTVRVRARDASGNLGKSPKYTLVIDRLPPQVGGTIFSFGPMILNPDANGHIYGLQGMGLKLTMSAVGGPELISLSYISDTFPMTKNIESGLWSGVVNLSKEGEIKLVADSVDGAKNETKRGLNTLTTLIPGKVNDENGHPLVGAVISVYTFEKNLGGFVVWDGVPYSQTNSQTTDKVGNYRLFLPAGKYFIEVSALGKRRQRTTIFEINQPTPINTNFFLTKANWFNVFWSQEVPMLVNGLKPEVTVVKNVIGTTLPDFDLSTKDFLFTNTSTLGKPTLITFSSSWNPQTADQMVSLDGFKTENDGVNVVTVLVQESASRAKVFKRTGGYLSEVVADPDGILVVPFDLQSLPTHVFLDRKGIIKDMVTGLLDKESILQKIIN